MIICFFFFTHLTYIFIFGLNVWFSFIFLYILRHLLFISTLLKWLSESWRHNTICFTYICLIFAIVFLLDRANLYHFCGVCLFVFVIAIFDDYGLHINLNIRLLNGCSWLFRTFSKSTYIFHIVVYFFWFCRLCWSFILIWIFHFFKQLIILKTIKKLI